MIMIMEYYIIHLYRGIHYKQMLDKEKVELDLA